MTGAEYKAQRIALGVNQTELAQLLGVSRRTIVRLETCDTVARADEYAMMHLVGLKLADAR